MFQQARKAVIAVAALGALALGGSALADAASTNSSKSQGSSSQRAAPKGRPAPPPNGRPGKGAPRGAPPCPPGARMGSGEKPLSGEKATKVKEAALAKVKGGKVLRTETDADHRAAYEAHVRKSNGGFVEVLVNKDFKVTDVRSMPRPPRPPFPPR